MFKMECILLWRTLERSDKLADLHRFMNTKREGKSSVTMYYSICNSMKQMCQDILNLEIFPKKKDLDTGDDMEGLKPMINCLSVSILHEICMDEERRALKKVP